MSFDFLPKNVIKGKTSDGKKFEAFEYSFETYALMQLGTFFSYLFVGGLICAIASPIILIMLMLQFTGRFNIIYLLIPIFSGYFIYDCANGWIFSALLNIFIEEGGLIFLTCLNISCVSVIIVMTVFGKSIYNYIVNKYNDATERYITFFFMMGVVFAISWFIASKNIDKNWLGVSKVITEETEGESVSKSIESEKSSDNNNNLNYSNENNTTSNYIYNEPMDDGYNEEQVEVQENNNEVNTLPKKEVIGFDYDVTYIEAENICQSRNMRLPTYEELNEISNSDLRVKFIKKIVKHMKRKKEIIFMDETSTNMWAIRNKIC